jgi:hypothetical protein
MLSKMPDVQAVLGVLYCTGSSSVTLEAAVMFAYTWFSSHTCKNNLKCYQAVVFYILLFNLIHTLLINVFIYIWNSEPLLLAHFWQPLSKSFKGSGGLQPFFYAIGMCFKNEGKQESVGEME